MTEWISIKDKSRIPENLHCYIVSDGKFVATAYWDIDGFVGCENDLLGKITHWMPLPNPLQEDI